MELFMLGGYFILLLVVGYLSSRKDSLEGYLIADRKLGSVKSGLSIVASKIGGGTILVLSAFVYVFGPSAYWYVIGSACGYVLFIFFARHVKRIADKKKFYTLMDYVRYRFGEEGSVFFAILVFFANMLNFIVQILGGGKIIQLVFGTSIELSIILMLGSILLYMVVGGFRAVVYTDAIQAVMFVVFLAVITVFMGSQVQAIPAFDAMQPSMIMGFFVIGLMLPFSGHELWQRVYATKKKSLVRSLIIGTTGYIFGGALIVTLGLVVKSLLPGVDPDISILVAFSEQLTGIIHSLGILALFAIIMSSADTWLFNCTAILFQDIIRKKITKKHFMYGFMLFSLTSFLASILMPSLVNYTLIYGVVYTAIGSLIVFGTLFKFKKRYMKLTYILTTVLCVVLLVFSGLRVEFVALGIVVVPVSYVLSIVLKRLFRPFLSKYL